MLLANPYLAPFLCGMNLYVAWTSMWYEELKCDSILKNLLKLSFQ